MITIDVYKLVEAVMNEGFKYPKLVLLVFLPTYGLACVCIISRERWLLFLVQCGVK